jgi:rhamnose transport system permease protein
LNRQIFALGLVILVIVGIGLKEPRSFASQSIESVLLWLPLILVAGLGQFVVIVSGGIDISIGSTLGLSGIVVGTILRSNSNLPVAAAMAIGFAVGLVAGMVNAAAITWGRISPLVATIGTLAAFRGIAFMVSKGDQIDSSMIPDSLTSLANTGIKLGAVNLNWLAVFAIGLACIFSLLLKNSIAGRNLFAYGSNAPASHLRGISSNAITFGAYTLCGGMAGLCGTLYAARFGFVNPGSAGQNLELTVIAAVAIGGAKLTGGSGSIGGVLLGCILLSCINVGLSVMGIDANWQLLAYGLVILTAILIDGLSTKRRVA